MSRPDIAAAYYDQNEDLYLWCKRTCNVCSRFLSARLDEDGYEIGRYCKRCEKTISA